MARTSSIFAAIFFLLATGSHVLTHAAGPRAPGLDASIPFFGAKFEPHGIYIIGQGETRSFVVWDCTSMGQVPCNTFGTIDKYTTAAGQDPIGVMQYITMDDWAPGVGNNFKSLGDDILRTIERHAHIPQIGTGFWPNGDTKFDDTAAAASGAYDGFWTDLANLLKSSPEAIFIRPGYEFGGTGDGSFYNPTNYKLAFQRMVNVFRAAGANNVAFVWDQYNEPIYMNFYPGDSYVDWWGINLFHAGDFTSPTTIAFMQDALAHNKPVMICEASLKDFPVTAPNAWSDYFGPIFDFMTTYPHVKAFSWINSSWSGFSGFEESRIEMDPVVVGPMFAARLADPLFLDHLDDTSMGGGTIGPSISVVPGEEVRATPVKRKRATVKWTTVGMPPNFDGTTTAQVEYGLTTLYGTLTKEKMKLKTDHKVIVKKLTPATTYHYRVHGFDANGFEIQSGDFTFMTLP